MKQILFALLALSLFSGCNDKPEEKQPIRHCVDKDNKVVEERLCEVTQAGGSDGMHWLFLYMLLRPGQSVPVSNTYIHTPPASGFVTHRSALAAPAPVSGFSSPSTPNKSSAPVRSSPSFTMPKSTTTYRSTPSYSSPSRSYSSPSRSSARYR